MVNIVLKRLTTWADDGSAKSIAEPYLRRSSHNPKSYNLKLAAAVTSKIVAGNFRAAIRLICSEDKPAPSTADTYEALKRKHPPAPDDRREPCDPRVIQDSRLFKCHLRTSPEAGKPSPQGHLEVPTASLHAIFWICWRKLVMGS